MSEIAETFKAMREQRQEDGRDRRSAATRMYDVACELADQAGMDLKRNSETHYTLFAGQFRYQLYPGNRRIMRDPGPHLKLPANWTLLDVVNAAIALRR
jgi:hypothetical protein